jgi:hypothetical protein
MGLGRWFFFVAALGLATAPTAFGQSLPGQMRASDILGREVRTAQGERLAIRDLVIDPASGKVEYLALGRAGAERGEKLRLYPVSALRSIPGNGLVLIVPGESSSAGGSALAPTLVEQAP